MFASLIFSAMCVALTILRITSKKPKLSSISVELHFCLARQIYRRRTWSHLSESFSFFFCFIHSGDQLKIIIVKSAMGESFYSWSFSLFHIFFIIIILSLRPSSGIIIQSVYIWPADGAFVCVDNPHFALKASEDAAVGPDCLFFIPCPPPAPPSPSHELFYCRWKHASVMGKPQKISSPDVKISTLQSRLSIHPKIGNFFFPAWALMVLPATLWN